MNTEHHWKTHCSLARNEDVGSRYRALLAPSIEGFMELDARAVNGQLIQSVSIVIDSKWKMPSILDRQQEEEKVLSARAYVSRSEIMKVVGHESATLFAQLAAHSMFDRVRSSAAEELLSSVQHDLGKANGKYDFGFENEVMLTSSPTGDVAKPGVQKS